MKSFIEGFRQEFAITLRKKVKVKDKEVEKKIDCIDLVILRWFVDFYPKMKKFNINGNEYAWLTHKKLKEDLPLIDISRQGFIDRMQKLVEFDVLTYQLVKQGGTLSLYGFGDNYMKLVEDDKNSASSTNTISGQTNEGMGSNQYGGVGSNQYGVHGQTNNKDSDINNTEINNSKLNKESKKEKSTTNYDSIINSLIFNENVKEAIIDFIKMRQFIKKPMSDRALKILINKLKKISSDSSTQVKILEQSIINNWSDIYDLKQNNNKSKDEPYIKEEFRGIGANNFSPEKIVTDKDYTNEDLPF